MDKGRTATIKHNLGIARSAMDEVRLGYNAENLALHPDGVPEAVRAHVMQALASIESAQEEMRRIGWHQQERSRPKGTPRWGAAPKKAKKKARARKKNPSRADILRRAMRGA